MIKRFSLVALFFVAACSDMQGYYPNGSVVTVDGVETLVRPLPNRANSYQAMPNNPTVRQMAVGVDAAIYARNVKAIEQVTGCKVNLTSISNSLQQTIAATDC